MKPLWDLVFAIMLAVAASGQASAYVLSGAKWPSPTTTMHLPTPLGSDAISIATSEAANAWNSVTPFLLVLQGSSPVDPCQDPNVVPPRNGIVFHSTFCGVAWGAGTLAVTPWWFADGVMIQAGILFNANLPWDIYHGPWRSDAADYRRVAVHELGHVVGLAHEESVPSIMNAVFGVGNPIETPQPDDIGGVNALYGTAPTSDIVIHLEEPAQGGAMSGVSNLRGWAIALNGIHRVELYIDGVWNTNIPSGGRRPDVGAAYPTYPESSESGFSMAFNYSNLAPGLHSIVVRAVDTTGAYEDAVATFFVARFDNPFIGDPAAFSMSSATLYYTSSSIYMENVYADGEFYDVILEWDPPRQGFAIRQISRSQ